MRQAQTITDNAPIQRAVTQFLNATAAQLRHENKASMLPEITAKFVCEPVIAVFCDLCDEREQGTRSKLDAEGWGLYSSFSFCPHHESSF